MSRVDDIINGVKKGGTEKKKSRVDSIIERSSNGNLKTGVDNDYIQSFISDANEFMSGTSSRYKDIGYSNASSYYDEYTSTSRELGKRADTIRAYLNSNRSNLDEKAYTSLMDSLDSFDKRRNSVWNQLRETANFYSKWKTEDDYNKWYEENQKVEGYKSVLDAEDFGEYSELGKGVKNPSWKEAQKAKVNNMVTFAEEYGYSATSPYAATSKNYDARTMSLIKQFMTDDEKGIYNYYIGKGDTEKAEEYLSYMVGVFKQKQGGELASAVDSTFLEPVFNLAAGVGNAFEGLGNIDNLIMGKEVDNTPEALDYAMQELSSNNKGVWKVVNDLANTTGNMLPSILVSTIPGIGPVAGNILFGASAAGNGYAEMKNLGYKDWQAAGYGTAVGIAEAYLQKFIGGIGSLGGKHSLTAAITKFVSKFDSALARLAIQVPLNMGAEALEEGIQTVLDPMLKELFTGEDFESPEWDEILYSSLLGALSAGMLDGAPTIAGTVINSAKAKSIYGVDSQALVTEALEIDPTNAHAQRMQARLDKGKNVSGYQINRLVEANENALVSQDKGKIRDTAKARLEMYGETGNVDAITDVITKIRSGDKITRAERDILTNSKFGRRVSTELNPETIKAGTHNTAWVEEIGTERIGADVYNRSGEQVSPLPTPRSNVNVIPPDDEEEKNAPEASTPITIERDGETVEVKPLKIASIGNGAMTIELEGGEVVDAAEVDFGGSGVGLVYQAATDMASRVGGFGIDTANVFVRGYNAESGLSAGEYVSGWSAAYRYGKMGVPLSQLNSGITTSKLTEEQRKTAYNFGKAFGNEEIANNSENIVSTETINAGNNSNKPTKKGNVYFDGSLEEKRLSNRQRASLKGLRVVSEAMGIDIHVFESPIVNGKRVGENGSYDPVTKTLRIDLYAGVKGDSLMLFTASHELTHHIREVAPGKFKVFADALFEEYAKNGQSIEELIEKKLETLEANGRLKGKTEAQAYDLAYEEVVADACESMLVDSNAMEALSKKLYAKDKGLWETVKKFIGRLIAKIKAIYKTLNPDSAEANLVRDMVDSAERLQKLWVDALLEASEVSTERTLGESGILVDSNTESASLMSVRDLLTDTDRKKVSKALAERFGVTQSEAVEWLKAETSLASLILNPKYSQYLDYMADANETAIKQNSDYPQGTVDFSNICKKRRAFTEVMNRVLRNFPNHVFEAADLAKIRTIMMEEGMEVACGICYVEDRRQLDSIVAQNFIDSLALYRNGSKTKPDGTPFNANQLKAFKLVEGDAYTPSIYELISLEGRNSLKAKNPAMEEAWVKFNNARGMQSVRLLLNEAEYKRQILKYTPAVVKRKNDLGGLRIYSFSDAEMFHLIDIIQVITDSATVGLSLQGYTKVNEYARAVKDTGEKLNRSLIPKGDLGYHMENGKVVLDFDTVEGIDINHPDFFDNIDNPNIGNIVIGINATQIRAAMTSKFIDQIIPFHTGQSGEVLGEKGIAAWDNYKDFQSERDAKTNKKSSHQINIYTEVINAAKAEGHPITNKVEFVNKFLEVCKKHDLIPRFSDFLNVDENGDYVYTEGYHKFLVDFKTFDQNTGEYLPQMPVKPIFDNEYITKLLTDYVKSQKAKDADVAKAMPKVLDRITKEIVKPSAKKYSDRDSSYLDAVNRGDMETAQRMVDEAAKAAGYTVPVWHGSDSIDRIKSFDTKRGGGGTTQYGNGSYFTDNEDLAWAYGKAKRFYLNPTNYFDNTQEEVPQDENFDALTRMLKHQYGFTDAEINRIRFAGKGFGLLQVLLEDREKALGIARDNGRFGGTELPNILLRRAGYDGIKAQYNYDYQYVAFYPEQVKSADPVTYDDDGNIIPLSERFNPKNSDIRYSDRPSKKATYAPTFYSHMGKVIDGIRLEKMGAGGVVPYLKGRGVKDEEIKWSGIEAFLEGKKSVTKQELQEFVAGSQLQIVEQMSDTPKVDIRKLENDDQYAYAWYDEDGNIVDRFYYDYAGELVSENTGESYLDVETVKEEITEGLDHTRWKEYKLDGGSNYRELVFQMPNASYSNKAMRAHWGDDAEGVIAHARVQDFEVDGKKMLFVEEIQSDWHNEGAKDGYADSAEEARVEKLKAKAEEAFFAVEDYSTEMTGLAGEWETIEKTEKGAKLLREYREAQAAYDSAMDAFYKKAPDAPFRTTYHEYALKRLIRMAAEEGYDTLGWTTADIQMGRWNPKRRTNREMNLSDAKNPDAVAFEDGYRIEYDQEMPKFLRKYGKRWDATVGKADIAKEAVEGRERVLKETELENVKRDIERAKRELAQKYDSYERAIVQRSIDSMERTVAAIEQELAASLSVWSMPITDSMKDSVLYEGQVFYSDRVTDKKVLNFLENQEHVTVYRAMQVIDGELYPPMAAKVKSDDGKKKLVTPSKIGAWEQAVERPDLIRNGNKFELDKANGSSIQAAYNPYFHTSASPLNDQFSSAYKRPNLVIVEGVIPASELTSGYRAEFAKDTVGETKWHSGPVASKLKGDKARRVFLSRWFKPLRIVPDSEVASIVAETLEGENIDVPYNVVTPSLRAELERVGVPIKYQDRNPGSYSNRSLLADALETAAQNDIEREKLKQYKQKIALINAEEQKLHDLREQIKELSFKKGPRDTEAIRSLQFEANQTANRINTYDRQLLNLESTKALKGVLEREKAMARKKGEQRVKEALERYRERATKTHRELMTRYQESRKKALERQRETRDKNDAKTKLQKLILETSKWISYPGKDDVKCPDILREPYAKFLQGIDLSSQRLQEGGDPTHNDERVANAMNNLANAIERIKKAQDPAVDTDKVLDSGYLDLPVEFVDKLREMAENISNMMTGGDYVINKMASTEIKQLSKLIKTLNHAIKEMSTLYANLRFANVEELGDNTISFLESLGEAAKTNSVGDFVNWDNALPYYAFKRFGEGGESIFTGLMDGQDKLARLAKSIFEFKDKTWTDKESKAWGEDTHTIHLPSGSALTLTTANAMGIYCLSRRDQGKQHLLGGGTRVIGIKKGAKKAADSRSTLTQEDIDTIVASLSEKQRKVADAIQEFMSTTCSEWGNEISMKRFLTKEFTDPNYYPIESNDENLSAKDPQAQQSDLYRLLNISATKPLTPGANNEVIIRNIFDVFIEHASDMAKLNAYGLALLDYMKWANYREKTVNADGQISVRGVHKAMTRAYGDKAWSYALNLIKDVNGRHNDNGDNSFLMSMMRLQKTASVGNNLRVAFLQFTSYPRASLVLSTKSLALGLTKKPQIEKAKKYCGIALWKSYGFYDTNIARSIEDQLKGTTSVRQKIVEFSMKGPEWADAVTWGALWNACEYEVAKTTKNKVGSEEFYQEVGLKLREVVYATQVVDSILTRSQIMRSKSGLTQLATAYMSEPTLTANIVMDADFQFRKEKRITGSAKIAWKKTRKIVYRAVGNYLILQLITSVAESLADAWRDDDEEKFIEKFGEAFGENLVTNLIPFNKIPIISDFADLLLSFFGVGFVSSDNLSTSWMTQVANAVKTWSEVLGEELDGEETSKTVYNAIYQTAKAISSMTGVSVSGAMREVVALWNNTAGAYDPTLKISQYDLTNAELGNELYEAMLSGEEKQVEKLKDKFDDDKAITSAIRKALRENDSRVKKAAKALSEGNIREYERILNEIVGEGHFIMEDVKAAIVKAYEDMLPDDEETTDTKEEKAESVYETEWLYTAISMGDVAMANAMKEEIISTHMANGKDREEAEASFNNSFTSSVKKYYEEGEISSYEAKNMLINFAGSTEVKATSKVQYWDYIQKNPDASVDDAWFTKYNTVLEDYGTSVANSGISVDMYIDYRIQVKDIGGETKKRDRMAVINSLPISTYQKDALYFAEGWSRSTLGEAPWH